MGLWPFGRKKSREISRGGAVIPRSEDVAMHDARTTGPGSRGHGEVEIASDIPERRRSRRDKKRRGSKESKKLKRNPERQRTYSFSPGRKDSIKVAPKDANRPPVPRIPADLKGKAARAHSEKQTAPPAGQPPARASTQPEGNSYEWQRMPTLQKRSAAELGRRKSSKRRKDDHDREAEIKAMAAFMPTRPRAEHNSSGRLVKRDSKKMRSGLNKNLQNTSSDISLPTVESMHTSLSSGSERQTSYKLSPFDMLAPRPTIKYADNPRYAPGASGFGSDRSDSRRRRVSERVTLDQEVMKANRRIEELADDLSASELRELMERDEKRRDKKKIAERIKVERKLARRQAKQNVDEAAAAREGKSPPVNMERGVMGREVVGLGIGNSAVVTSSKRKPTLEADNDRGKRPAELRQDSESNARRPIANFQRTESLATENLTPGSERYDPIVELATIGTVAKAQISPPSSPRGHKRGQSSISQMIDINKVEPARKSSEAMPPAPSSIAPVQPEAARKSSESNSFRGRASSSWISFFRRSRTNKSNKRDSAPSSFSNTSRDSMQNISFSAAAYTQKPNPNMPRRTMSRFREDLPELPPSPPYSRVQSVEADIVPPIREYPEKKALSSADDLRVRYDTPNSGYRSLDAMRMQDATPTTGHRVEAPSPRPIAVPSQSLASIDSEGSWLSGGKGGSKRGSKQSVQIQSPAHEPLHDSANNLSKRYKEYSESAEELGIAEDEYFSRLTPGPEDQLKIHRVSTGNPMPSSDEEDGGSLVSPVPSEKSKWGAVGRRPTVVHREPRAKSREGLLNESEDDAASSITTGDSPTTSPKRKSQGRKQDVIDENEPDLQRATSVDYNRSGSGHARRISAGSARLLDLKAGEPRRMSSG